MGEQLAKIYRYLTRTSRITAAVHPHGRGDWSLHSLPHCLYHGSPPRAWGLAQHKRRQPASRRFTPTGVGTGKDDDPDRNRWPVHPHGRGDWSEITVPPGAQRGSPPRAWGLAGSLHLCAHSTRFTPTGVGTGRQAIFIFTPLPVHPHGRGDWLTSSRYLRASDGSPPRAWGLDEVYEHVRCETRFTPTGVGTGVSRHRKIPGAIGSPPRAWGLGDRRRRRWSD